MSVVEIDENNLDRECIRLPSDYLKFAHLSADKKRDVAEAANRLKVVEADIAKAVRDNPGAYGLEKVTEGAIKEIIISKSQKAVRDLRDAEHQADIAHAVVQALEHKKRAVTLLVELHGMSYFANPKVSERGREAVNAMTRKANGRRFPRED